MVKFVTDVFSEDEANVVAFGVDCPPSLRKVSQLVEPFDITEQRNFLENSRIFDAGDISLEKVEQKVKDVLERRKLPLILAKEHTVTLHAVHAMPAGTRLVVFDAHPDLKDEYEGSKSSHACWLRRLCETFDCKDIAIFGIRSGEEDELEFLKSKGILHFTARQVKDGPQDVSKALKEFVNGSNVYVSVDIDVFDPSIAPAVKYPEPGGMTYGGFLQLADALKGSNIVGLDCIEIRPIKENRITEFLAVKVIFKLLSLIV